MEKILTSTEDFDVELFDRVVESFYTPEDAEHKRAQEVLMAFRDHPDSWARVSSIMQESKDTKAKVFSLQVLERTVKIRWSMLGDGQKESVRGYVINQIVTYIEQRKKEKVDERILQKLNQILVEILKREWPQQWAMLIMELLEASSKDFVLCINTFRVLEQFCDDIYNFPKSMVRARAEELRREMGKHLNATYTLGYAILDKMSKGEVAVPKELVEATLSIVLKIVPEMEKNAERDAELTDVVCRYIDTEFSTAAIQILSVVLEKEVEEKDREVKNEMAKRVFVSMSAFAEKYVREFELAYKGALKEHYGRLIEKDRMLIKKIVLYFSKAYEYGKQMEVMGCNTVEPLEVLLEISKVNEFEIFRLCTEFWHKLVRELFLEFPFSPAPVRQPAGLRRGRYSAILPKLARVLIEQMPRPEEVLITENENGEVVMERLSETEYIVHYTEVKETLFNIASIVSGGLGHFLQSEAEQLFGIEWSRERASKIAWAIGAISESMSVTDEKDFLIKIVTVFLKLCERKSDPGDRAIIASCLMYIISQNPRFLQAHWTFLSIITQKIVEFMSERVEGVAEMACDIFVIIMTKCGKEMSVVQEKGKKPMAERVLETLPEIVAPLAERPYLVERVYEGMCYMVGNRVRELLKYAVPDLFVSALDTKEALQNAVHAVRKVRIVCSTNNTAVEYTKAREIAIEDVYIQMQRIYERLWTVGYCSPVVAKWIGILKKEMLDTLIVIATHFSIEFVHRGFMGVCSQIILLPMTTQKVCEFVPATLDLLAALCRRTVQDTLRMVEQIAEPVAKIVLNDPIENEELMKAFYNMLCASIRVQSHPGTIESIEWIAFGASQTHREVSEMCIETIAYILSKGSIEVIRAGYFGLLECIVGAALDKDHEGGIDALLQSLSALVRYSIEGRCPNQEEVTNIFGSRLYATFSHLKSGEICAFIHEVYNNANSHDGLLSVIDDFRVRSRTI